MHLKHICKAVSVAALLGVSAVAAADHGSAGTQQSSTLGTMASDGVITATIKAGYINDARLKDTDISVTTVNGVVTLQGSAPTSDARGVAGDIAKSVEGVSRVDNDIRAPSLVSKIEQTSRQAAKATGRMASDSWITTKVKSALLADSVTKGFKISVTSRNHVVTLSGAVDTQASIDRAVSLALQIKGVASIDTGDLTVARH